MFSSVFTLHFFKWSVVSSDFQDIVLHVCKEQGMVREGNIISLKLNQGGPTTTTLGISERSQGVGRGVTERSNQGEPLTPHLISPD